jgi:MFS family permease
VAVDIGSQVQTPVAMPGAAPRERAGGRAWAVFAVSFALLLSDYMSRQVLAAVFPLLKAGWGLSDARLGALGGVVALMVGVLTVPLSLVADRVGRARSVAAMALTWSLATLGCAFCASYGQLMLARAVLGVGEAAYGSVGLAVVFTYFPKTFRATITGAFMAGGLFGSFAGLILGGSIAAHFGWRGAFVAMALFGLALAGAYALVVRRDRGAQAPGGGEVVRAGSLSAREVARGLFGAPAVVLTYVASGLQLFVLGALTAWTPSYLNRALGLAPAQAAAVAAGLLLTSGVGMIAWGWVTDRLCAARPGLRAPLAGTYALATFAFLEAAFALPPGPLALVCALTGLFCAGATAGPAGAIVADSAPLALHGAALAVLTLANNLIGLAPGPAVAGLLADHFGLQTALRLSVGAALPAAAAFALVGHLQRPTRTRTSGLASPQRGES